MMYRRIINWISQHRKKQEKLETSKTIDKEEPIILRSTPLPLPVCEGDVVIFRSDNRYMVEVIRITGNISGYSVFLRWLNRPNFYTTEEDVFKNKSWSTVRELNYWLDSHKKSIKSIHKTEYSKRPPQGLVLSIERCHEEAIEWEKNRQRVLKYMEKEGIQKE
jgi:hypothetical protein